MRNSRMTQMLWTRIALAAAAGIPAFGAQYTFNFNTLASGATASQIAASMTSYLNNNGCPGCSVSVTGAIADQTWAGDGHVVGPGGKPLTLGTSDGATSNSSATPTGTLNRYNQLTGGFADTFIANTSDGGNQISNEFYLKFSGLAIASASFDYEIFPDGSPQQPPDLTFQAGNNSNGSDAPVTTFGTAGTQYGVKPGSGGADGSSTRSPLSSSESSAQYIGTWSGNLANVSELDFIDWPATIGIDNLVINTPNQQSPVPEPGSVILLGTLVAGISALIRRRANQA